MATFEAAARLASFTLAAAELGVTQAAVSRQIKVLEDDLNAPLFVRAHRKVVLTPAGKALASTVTQSFAQMAEMIETIRRPNATDAVSVGATLAFSHFWILPRLSEFRALHPDIRLKLIAEDSTTDLRRDRLDVCIRYGKPPFPDANSIAHHPDQVFAVCSPALLQKLDIDRLHADITRMPLIASDNVNPAWLTWRSWAQAVGLGPALGKASDRSRLRFNHYTDTIEAALNGEGVALGWAALLANHMAQGRLVKLGPHVLTGEEAYHVLVPKGRTPSPSTQIFLDWLAKSFAMKP
ncbi:LysR substrate-binding domain-containing protein [Neogemmobacter tilapiae]|uniref:LysR substrate-binding domain-containing protein n=1 Tax=Neogemmobacter tilapiae TaxID=875041 RepID=UPI001E3F0A91|nr:LysR substrate-binding domain-containing protein [Gemmobacter tilapiae]